MGRALTQAELHELKPRRHDEPLRLHLGRDDRFWELRDGRILERRVESTLRDFEG